MKGFTLYLVSGEKLRFASRPFYDLPQSLQGQISIRVYLVIEIVSLKFGGKPLKPLANYPLRFEWVEFGFLGSQ